jgi:transposase
MRTYSREIKETMVKKICSPGGPSALRLSRETGISQTALSKWVKQFGGKVSQKNRRPEDWSPEERLQAVLECQGLKNEELGEFLRRKGLHTQDVDAWKTELISFVCEIKKNKRGRPKKNPELVALEAENKKLKRDLRRKDRALAEQTAIVILQKKAQELWGTDEGDE